MCIPLPFQIEVLRVSKINFRISMISKITRSLFTFILFGSLATAQEKQIAPVSINKVSDHTYMHRSMIETETGKYPCNGMVYINDQRAFVFDTPPTIADSEYLINLIEDSLGAKVVGVIVTHFHEDALGGLDAFLTRGIHSYANNRTIPLAAKMVSTQIQFAVPDEFELPIRDDVLHIYYPGAGHTEDNSVVYVEGDQVLFGGCLVKANNGRKGNLADAKVEEWSNSIDQLKEKFPDVRIVVPGHGKMGGPELLDYTAELFDEN
jgi:metallo-beta-lactamase class B